MWYGGVNAPVFDILIGVVLNENFDNFMIAFFTRDVHGRPSVIVHLWYVTHVDESCHTCG